MSESVNVFFGHIAVSESNVAVNGVRPQKHVLHSHTDISAQGLQLDEPDIYAVHQNLSALRVVQSGYHVHQRGFSRACFAHNGYGLPCVYLKAHVFQDRRSVVGKAYVFKFNAAPELFGHFLCVASVYDERTGIIDLYYL